MHRGYVKVWRKIQDWEWHDDLTLVGFFVHLVLTANYKDSKYHGHVVPRGSLVFGRKAASKRFGLGEQVIRTMLAHLKSTNDITIKTTNRFSIISIVNFEKYQENPTNKITTNTTNNQPATNQQLTTSKEHKKERKKEYIHASEESKATKGFDPLDAFNALLSLYPNSIGESRARRMFFEWEITESMFSRMRTAVKNYKTHLAANTWKTPMNFNSFLESWTDWENHQEIETEDQKFKRLKERLKA